MKNKENDQFFINFKLINNTKIIIILNDHLTLYIFTKVNLFDEIKITLNQLLNEILTFYNQYIFKTF